MQDLDSVGGEIWSEKMVSHSPDAERKDWETMQREMAQSSKA